MQARYSLRFESGERDGEVVPVTPPRFSVGRKPGNSLQINDGSVSGKHAELVVEADGGLLLRDLGSTNGTRVGTTRIEEQPLAHGDRVTFGNVVMVVADAELAERAEPSRARRAGAAPNASTEDGAMLALSAEAMAKSKKRSRAPLLFGLAALLALAGAGYTLFGGGSSGDARSRPVVAVAGNLLASGYSFETSRTGEGEDDDGGWLADEAAPESFLRRAEARHTGQMGMQAELEPGTWAGLVSQAVAVREGQTLQLAAALRPKDGVAGRIGVEFLRGEGADAPGPLFHASAFRGASEEGSFEELALTIPVPPACSSARVRVEARAGSAVSGSLDVDDVSLVSSLGPIQPAVQVGEFRLFGLGEPLNALALYKVARPLIGDLHVQAVSEGALPATIGMSIEPRPEGKRLVVGFDGAGGDALLTLRVEPDAARGGIATMGPTGYREHGAEFEREDVSALLLGDQGDLVALRFDPPVTISAVGQEGGARVRVALGAARSFELQVDFEAERARAGDLAHQARNAGREGKVGESLAAWDELLANYPFEAALVSEAESARAGLVQAGAERLAAAREVLARASFFRLHDLYLRSQALTTEVLASYAGTEVGERAEELMAEIDAGLGVLEEELDQDEVQRLRSIQAFLEASGSTALAAEVGAYLAEEYGVTQ